MSQPSSSDGVLPRRGNGPYQLLRGLQDGLVQRFLRSVEDPEGAQRQRLEGLLASGKDSVFGREHGLAAVRNLDDFRAAVPIRSYDALFPWLTRVAAGEHGVLGTERVSGLLETSGTTSAPKHLPVTASWAQTCGEAQKLWMLGLLQEHEAVARGAALTVVSPAEHDRSAGGLPIGSNTGRMHLQQPWYVRMRFPIPYEVFCTEPSVVRQYLILRFALQARLTSLTTANPSTVLLLCRRLLEWQQPLALDLRDGTARQGPAAELEPGVRRRLERKLRRHPVPNDWRPASIWPLASVNCWKGGPAAYFADRLPDALGAAVPVREVGITASEGFFAFPLHQDWPGSVLWTGGHVLEFVDDAGDTRGAWELEEGATYRLVVSTSAGLWRYDLDDRVKVVGWCGRTPQVRFLGKGGRYLNAVGERVAEAQVGDAVRQMAAEMGFRPVGFTARIDWAERPRYRLGFEADPGQAAPPAERLAAAFDRHLGAVNVEYRNRRESDRLGPPLTSLLPAGTYVGYRQQRVAAGAPEGQVKDPILALDDTEWQRLVGAEEPTWTT
jgi:GH3 auxin-responsive promoter